jgi:acyl-CoA synthetase (AMP-forming)/AMP-acid ligase II
MTEVDTARPTVPIGAPITNTTAYVLDEDLDPVPVGVAGELCLGGAGLARGYLGRPGLTADRFVPDAFGPAGGRLYRTGDLVRLLPSGQIEFLGRIDGQVKIRGYRIETGEVRAVLSGHPAVREAAVVARDDGPGGTRALVAYLVARDARASDAELRGCVRDRLPEYMMPSAFVWLDEIPLTRNSKADLAALPAPRYEQSGAGPRTPTEEAVRQTWEHVLGVADIDRTSRFFDVGGNSLLLAELFEQLSIRFPEAGLSLVELFEFTTYADIAAAVDQRTAAPAATTDYDI